MKHTYMKQKIVYETHIKRKTAGVVQANTLRGQRRVEVLGKTSKDSKKNKKYIKMSNENGPIDEC